MGKAEKHALKYSLITKHMNNVSRLPLPGSLGDVEEGKDDHADNCAECKRKKSKGQVR